MHERSAQCRRRRIRRRKSRDYFHRGTLFFRKLFRDLQYEPRHAVHAGISGRHDGDLFSFHRQIHRFLATVDFLTHPVSDDFFIGNQIADDGDVGAVSDDDFGILDGTGRLRRHFLFVTRSDADDPDNPTAIATVTDGNFVFARSVRPEGASVNAAASHTFPTPISF